MLYQPGTAIAAFRIGFDGDDIVSARMRENLKLRNIPRDRRVVLSFAPPPVPGEWMSPHAVVRRAATIERARTAVRMNRLAPLCTGVGPWVQMA